MRRILFVLAPVILVIIIAHMAQAYNVRSQGGMRGQGGFSDTKNYKYSESINFIRGQNLVSGYADGTFKPNQPVNRAEFLTVLISSHKNAPQNLPSQNCFSDVTADAWYSKYVCAAKQHGLISGYSDGTFKPSDPISPSDARAILQKAYGVQSSTNLTLPDASSSLTRGQMAELLARVIKGRGGQSGTSMAQKMPTNFTPPTNSSPPPSTTVATSTNGSCALASGTNTITAAGRQRTFILQLPANPNGAPVVFMWHAHGGTPERALNGMAGSTQRSSSILVAPAAIPTNVSDWGTDRDLALFDGILDCLNSQYHVDMNRISTLGFSAGGLWSTNLTMYRADKLASAVILSGGLSSTYHKPASPIPVILAWGGTDDTAGGQFPFESATLDFSNDLRRDGSFVIQCNHGGGHKPPPDSAFMWQFIGDHPKGVSPEPYATGLPSSFPSYCEIAK